MNPQRLEEGTILNGRYRILRPLGKGGMGTVYLAEHEQLKTLLAVKEIKASPSTEGETNLADFVQEARMLVHLNHPNLPKVNDAFIEGDAFYLIMEYIEGTTLESLLRERKGGALDVGYVVEWGLQIADVLSYLHRQDPPIIFRDVKPANIMLQPDGVVRLIDFGIARRFNPESNKDTSLLGSVGYSPPEQFGRQQTDMRSDVYAFGATLHHLLTAIEPSLTPFKFKPVSQLNPEVPPQLSELIARCVLLDVESRPASMTEVLSTLKMIQERLVRSSTGVSKSLQQGQVAPLSSDSKDELTGNGYSKKRVVFGTSIALLLLALVGILVMIQSKHPAKVSKPQPKAVPQPVAPAQTAPTISSNLDLPPQADPSSIQLNQPQIILQHGILELSVPLMANVIGHPGMNATMAIFFYNADNSPLMAVNSNSIYSNPDGQLSTAVNQSILQTEQTINLSLPVPLSLFPTALFAQGATSVRVRALMVINGEKFYSHRFDFSLADLYAAYSASNSIPLNPTYITPGGSNTSPGGGQSGAGSGSDSPNSGQTSQSPPTASPSTPPPGHGAGSGSLSSN